MLLFREPRWEAGREGGAVGRPVRYTASSTHRGVQKRMRDGVPTGIDGGERWWEGIDCWMLDAGCWMRDAGLAWTGSGGG